MFDKVLIANRGEIAVRIIRALKELDITTVAVYSEADREALHVRLADEAYCIGPSAAGESYLNIPSIMSVAEVTSADAIHPGYGFLAENSHFAEVCETTGIKFIGPDSETIALMGDKAEARKRMVEAGVPVIPGTEDSLEKPEEAKKIARDVGFPVIIKAAFGGGGKGMRIVEDEDSLNQLVQMARSEAKASFENETVYLEKYLQKPRHIEFQILGDERGNIIHLGERECTLQRRHQKVLEEAPSPAITEQQRQEMGEMAVRAAKEVGYSNAGTVEFLLDADGNYYFIEMNTRIQVEHPVTEFVTGVDLVKEQIKVATGEKLSFSQDDIEIEGAAIECRINAEDPAKDFRPSPGKIEEYIIPGGPGVRIDSGVFPGYYITPFYDSMVAKLITWDEDRNCAIRRMRRSLQEFIIKGIETTIPFHLQILNHRMFQEGNVSTDFITEQIMPIKE